MTSSASAPRLLGRRQVLRAALVAGSGLVVAACAAPVAPRWTFAPPARPGTTPPTSAPSPGASAAAGSIVRIVAENFAFDLAEFSVPANTPFRLEFDHRDVKIPHNVAIYDAGPDGADLFRGEIFPGPKVVVYEVPGLPRGRHYFQCDPHPYMNGSLVVS